MERPAWGQPATISHPDLGGMGQWSSGGTAQVGDMFNKALKDKVNALCSALAKDAADQPAAPPRTGGGSHDWWPEG